MRKGTCMTAGPNHGEKSLLRRPPAWTERRPPCVQAMDPARLQQILGSMQQGGPGAAAVKKQPPRTFQGSLSSRGSQ